MAQPARAPFASMVPLLALAGCANMLGTSDPTNPGDPIGSYALVANVDDTSTCAELAAAQPRPWDFDVKLRHDGTTAYWIANGSPIAGTLDTTKGTFAFSTTESMAIHDAIPAQGLGACTIIRTDDFSGTFAGDPTTTAGGATLTGTLRYGYVVSPGSDCRDLVGDGVTSNDPLAQWDPTPQPASHGQFSVLPCYLQFAVTGTRSAT